MYENDTRTTKRALIFTGGTLGRWALDRIEEGDFLVGADRGAAFLIDNGRVPDLALGDFDSVTPPQLENIRRSSRQFIDFDAVDKDWTDTELALRETIARGYRLVVLLGAIGTRFDHSLANVQLLEYARERGCLLLVADERNEIRLCDGRTEIEHDAAFSHVSLLPLTYEVKGITLTGFRYPLHEATIRAGASIGVSNVLDAPAGRIEIKEGLLLVIRTRD
ncbi:thiamine diphosphokinase [Cohnella suwonensis]|uniref:Thiamine diphosphokinase n=1 Tax=Cohnella suwonensis TaxID=696072 RepID=A0ABW0LP31_9BACL